MQSGSVYQGLKIAKYFSCTDATSFALIERTGKAEAFIFDDHFKQYGLIRLSKK